MPLPNEVTRKRVVMRKRLITDPFSANGRVTTSWIDLESVATAEVTSEEAAHGIECALTLASNDGWRASVPGDQLIRLVFDQPQNINRIHIVFHERRVPRTQEITLRWSPDHGQSFREIVRQQYTFSPAGATSEVEDYVVQLDGVTVLELRIRPDITGNSAYASLEALRVA